MFRSHFTRGERIVWGTNLEATTLMEAANEAALLLVEHSDRHFTGYEIWTGCKCLLRGTNAIDETTGTLNEPETIPAL